MEKRIEGIEQQLVFIRETLADTYVKKEDLSQLSSLNNLKNDVETNKTNIKQNKDDIDSISNKLDDVLTYQNMSQFLSDYYTKYESDNKYLTNQSLDNYLTKEQVESIYINNEELVKKLEDYVPESDLELQLKDYVKVSDFTKKLSKKVDSQDLNSYYTKTQTNSQISSVLSDYTTTEKLTEDILPEIISSKLSTGKYVNEEYVDERFNTLSDKFSDYVLTNNLNSIISEYKFITEDEFNNYTPNLTDYVKNSDLNDVYDKLNEYVRLDSEELSTMKTKIDSIDLTKYVKIDNLPDTSNYITTENIDEYIPKLTGYATRSYVMDQISKIELGRYLKISDISKYLPSLDGYATKIYVKNQISDYITGLNITDYVTQGYVDGTFLRKSDFLNDTTLVRKYDMNNTLLSYAKKSETVTDLKLTNELKSYAKLTDVYKKTYIDNNYYTKKKSDELFLTEIRGDKIYLRIENAEKTYLTQASAQSLYLSKEDYRGIKDAMTLNSQFQNNELGFQSMLNSGSLMDGFYIVGDKAVVVKNNQQILTKSTDSYTMSEIDNKINDVKEWTSTQYITNWVSTDNY